MSANFELNQFGGQKSTIVRGSGNSVESTTEDMWNFGLVPKTQEVENLIQATPSMYTRLPALQGKWDGKTTVNHWDAVRKVLGDKAETLIQMQPRGTCGGRAGSLVGDMLQCIAIASGKRAKFHRVSHAAVYYAARKYSGMLRGNWTNDNSDGVASGSVPQALTKVTGYVERENIGDDRYYGEGSDDLACMLGAGMKPEIAAKIEKEGADNLITVWSPVNSAQELADGIAAGGMGIGSDVQGFTLTRDNYGFCSPSGTWAHYQVRCSVGVFNGRKGFGYAQSWGRDCPTGTQLQGHPGNCFGVDFDTQDRIIKSGDWAVMFSFPLFELEKGGIDIDWTF